jgi:hypothetical protein
MANYIITECLTNDEYIISAATLTLGATIEFDISEARFCGTVGAVTENPITLNISFVQLHDDCCTCLSGITGFLNFKFIRCGTSEVINIESINFCNDFGLPTTGLTYEIQFGSETSFCATFDGLSSTGETNYSYVSGPFSLCEDCGQEPIRSANTETVICEVCSGNTIVLIPPHAQYSDAQNNIVIQMNTIALGGENGLNN